MTAAAVAAEAAAAEARAASWWWRRPGCRHTATLCTPPLPKTACCFCWLLFAFPPAYPVAVISVVLPFAGILASSALAAVCRRLIHPALAELSLLMAG